MSTLGERKPGQEGNPDGKVTNYVRELRKLPIDFLQSRIRLQKNRHKIESDSLALAYVFLDAGLQTLRGISDKYDSSPQPNNEVLKSKISDNASKEPDAAKAGEIRSEVESLKEGYAAFAFGLAYIALDEFMDKTNQKGLSSRTYFAEIYNGLITGTLLPKIDPQYGLPANHGAKLTESNEEQIPPVQLEKLHQRLTVANGNLLVLLKNRSWKLLPTYIQSFLFRTGVDNVSRGTIATWYQELQQKFMYADTSRRLLASVFNADNTQEEQVEQSPTDTQGQPSRRERTNPIADLDLRSMFGDLIPDDF